MTLNDSLASQPRVSQGLVSNKIKPEEMAENEVDSDKENQGE